MKFLFFDLALTHMGVNVLQKQKEENTIMEREIKERS